MNDCVIGIDIGGTNFRLAAVCENQEVHFFKKVSSEIFKQNDAAKRLCDFIECYIENYSLSSFVKAVSIGIPAVVSGDKRKIISAPNLKGFEDCELVSFLEHKLSLPVFLDRDVNFLLYSDLSQLDVSKDKTVCAFYVGTGLGNAIFIDGKIHSGKNSAAGELGHIPLFENEDECACGLRGCAESRCSGKYLEKLCEKYYPNANIHEIFKLYPHSKVLTDFVRLLAKPISTEITILDPDFSIIAGGVVDMPSFPKELLEKEIRSLVRKPYPQKNLKLYFFSHNQQSGVLGSAAFAFNKLNKEKSL